MTDERDNIEIAIEVVRGTSPNDCETIEAKVSASDTDELLGRRRSFTEKLDIQNETTNSWNR